MSESLAQLTETAERLFSDLAARREDGFDVLWPQTEAAGFDALLLSEAEGGFGGDWQDVFAVARLAGFHALPLPVADAALGRLLAGPGEGFAVVAPACEGSLEDGRFTGRLTGVPWGRHAHTVIAACDGALVALERSAAASIGPRENPAGEPRDTLPFEAAAARVLDTTTDAIALAALLRAAQIAGALDAALGLSIAHANDRSQFGKPIARFQAVQQGLAVFAEEAAAVNCAGQAAARAADRGDAGFEIAAAKLRANQAAGVGAAVAHQVHGAIGFTREHPLHHLTRRLSSWRAEFGGDRHWAERLGRQAAALGPEGFWPELVRRSDAA